MKGLLPPEVEAEVTRTFGAHPHPLMFVTLSGAHLYGFASPDSDFDLRGVHLLPPAALLGLDRGPDTVEEMIREPFEIDLVTHDAEKFFRLLLRPNGYVLEQLYSPLVLRTSPEHEELKEIAKGCITRLHIHHYRGFAENQWSLFRKEDPPRIKPLLYTFRVLLTGIHLLRTDQVEANLRHLNEEFRLPFLDDLIARKSEGTERGLLEEGEADRFETEYARLMAVLEDAAETSALPERPAGRGELHELLLRVRGC
ncbi:MAG: nucleotidyltransferase domain-containing protein [Thermoanaerobaculia bacterium]